MNRNDVISVLIDFFREEYENDEIGISVWLQQRGWEAEELIKELDTWWPPHEKST
jgi:hypothetical protein